MNRLRTVILLGALTGLLMLIGGYFGGKQGMVIAFLFAVVMNFGSYWFSDRIVLSMYRGREVSESQAPELYGIVKNLALRAGLPMPRVCIIPSETPNAFATGRDYRHAVVAVTEGLLRILNRDELEGVLGHELTHVKNRDILIGSIAATLAGAVMMLASMAKWAAIFGAGGRDGEEGGGPLGLLVMAILAPWRPCSSRWPFPVPGNTWPMTAAPPFPASPTPWPAPWKNFPGLRKPCPWRPIPRQPTCLP